MKTTTNALFLAATALALAGAAGCGTDDAPVENDDASISLADLHATTIQVQRDGVVNHYPRRVNVAIPLPEPTKGCATLEETVTITFDGRPPLGPIARGGTSTVQGWLGGPICEGASADFPLSDEGGTRVLRFQQGDSTAEIAFQVPALEQIEMMAPTTGHARPGDLLTVRVPQSFYDVRGAAHPTPRAIGEPITIQHIQDAVHFDNGLFRDVGTPMEDFNAGVLGDVGIGTDDVTVQVPTYATAGAKRFYLTYSFWGDWKPMAIDRCDGFGGCTGTARDNDGLLGPIDITID